MSNKDGPLPFPLGTWYSYLVRSDRLRLVRSVIFGRACRAPIQPPRETRVRSVTREHRRARYSRTLQGRAFC